MASWASIAPTIEPPQRTSGRAASAHLLLDAPRRSPGSAPRGRGAGPTSRSASGDDRDHPGRPTVNTLAVAPGTAIMNPPLLVSIVRSRWKINWHWPLYSDATADIITSNS